MRRVNKIFGTWSSLHTILDKKHKKLYALMVGISIFSAVLEILGIALLLHTVLSILKPEFIQHNLLTSYLYNALKLENTRSFILVITSLLFVLYTIKNVILVQLNKLQVRYAFKITDKLSGKHYKRIAEQELLYFKTKKSAEIINELITTTLSFPETILLSSIMLISELCVILLMLGAILIYNPYLFLFTFVTVFPTAALLIYINRKRLSKKGLRLHTIIPLIYENITELTNGISNIKLWNGADYFYNRYSKFKKESYALKENIYVNSQFVPIRIYEVIAITGILCVVLFGILGDQSTSSIISYISIYAGVSFRLLPSVNRIITSSNSLSTNDYMLSYLEDGIVEKPIVKKSRPLHFTDNIALDKASFGYSPNMNVFQDVSLKIDKGQFIGIVGLSGSGKSTLVNTIASLIEPTSGKLKLDDKVIDKENCRSYRFLFSYVKQDVFMLNASIVKNIAFLDEKPDIEKVKECIAKVNLEEWVGTLTQGIDTNVGELGGQISGGQRQRIAIARALYKDASIFIFDEVTNNLDSYSREQTLKAISLLKDAGKTAIFITHKEDELKLCDRVYSLENKNLVSL